MRHAWLLLSALALLAPSALASGAHAPDDAGDVVLIDDEGERPADLPAADVRFVGVARGTLDARVTVGYGAPIPVDLALSVVLQLGPRPSEVAVVEVWRRPWERGPVATISYATATGETRVAEGRAAFAEDAVQLVLPAAVAEGRACLELRSLRSTHHAEEGGRFLDVVEPASPCAPADPRSPASTPEESVASTEGTSYALPRDVYVPGPGLLFGVVGLVVAAAISRRR